MPDHVHTRDTYATLRWENPRKNKTTRGWHCQCGAVEVLHTLRDVPGQSTVWVPWDILDQMEVAN